MVENMNDVLLLVVGITALFGVVMVAAIRFSHRNATSHGRGITAASVLAQWKGPMPDDAELLYGVWQRSLTRVVLVVRNGSDTVVGTITRGLFGSTISIDGHLYAVIAGSGWRERARLLDSTLPSTSVPLCSFEARGWNGNRIARYVFPEGSPLSLHSRWSWSRQPAPVPLLQDGLAAGSFCTLGGWAFNRGRALLLPAVIPLPVRLFILCKALGEQGRSPAH